MRLILFLASLLFFSTVRSSCDGQGSRRDLHEPLVPIQWTPPPPTPDFSDPPPAPAGQTPTAADVSARSNSHSSATKNIVIAVFASVAALAILFLSGFLLYRLRIRRPPNSAKPIAGEDGSPRRFRTPGRPSATAASEVLYLGTMEPAGPGVSGELNGSPYRKLSPERVVEVRHPSPELRPLPPLAGPPLRREVVPPSVAFSDDETFYTAQQSVASMASGSPSSPVSRRSIPSVGSAGKDVFGLTVDSAPPRSRRSPSRRQLSNDSASHAKQMIPPITRQPPPPPPPPPPPLPSSKTEKIVGTRPPRPPPRPLDVAGRIELPSEAPAPPLPAELSHRRRLLKPLPPEGASINKPILFSKFSNGDGCSSSQPVGTGDDLEGDAKPKLKPLHWDRVRPRSDRPMVWDQLKSGSFQ